MSLKMWDIISWNFEWRTPNLRRIFLIVFGFLVHVLVLFAAFEVYFSSPIDNGMAPIKSTDNAPAKRVVLLIADGLRADAIFPPNSSDVAPNLNAIKDTRGSWGIAHTRVPTESRPGHVAILGGIYEDPSAVLKGWSSNPVDFDSVVNQSTNAWCWGGPSIINMFNKDNKSHIHLASYDPHLEDFGNNNTIGLDQWVFERVENFFDEFLKCNDCKDVMDEGNLFFMHLLGIDTAGHAFKPYSFEYTNNINFVDAHIPKVEEMFSRVFPDNKTAFVFTADHGMTDWGSHGDGSHHETMVPLIAWGSGIKIDGDKKNVNQIDIAPLLAGLLGINYPINSLGRIPVEYLEASEENKGQMLISNVLQVLEIFNVKMLRRMQHAIRFVPFKGVTTEYLDQKVQHLKDLLKEEDYFMLNEEADALMKFLIEGADYYHNYFQLPILVAITIGMVAWILILLTFNVELSPDVPVFLHANFFFWCIFLPLYLNAAFFIYIQNLPSMYYIYFFYPILMVQILANRYQYILESLRRVNRFGLSDTFSHAFVFFAGLKILVKGFATREALCLVILMMTAFIFWSRNLRYRTKKNQKISWICYSIVVALFPLSPVMKTSFNIVNFLIGYFLWCIAFGKFIMPNLEGNYSLRTLIIQFNLFRLTPLYVLAVEFGIVDPESWIKNLAWLWAAFPIILIPFSPKFIYYRITSIFLAFGTFYLMVCSNYENLFLTCFVLLLYTWISIESDRRDVSAVNQISFDGENGEDMDQSVEDFRRAFFFVVFIFVAFFGTGNIASLNSFDPMWVRCFLTVFSPFKMSALILIKVATPFLFVSCSYRAINVVRQGNTLNLFCIVLVFSDVMLLDVLYGITNIGSWLEIGVSLSQFIIMEAFVLILILVYGLGYYLTTASYL